MDVDVYGDVPLFVNPGALRRTKSEWAQRCTSLMRDFMQTVVGLVNSGDTDEAYRLLMYLKEPNETHLGMTGAGKAAKGNAVGREFAELIIDAIAKSAAGKSGLIVDLEDTVLMIEGLGSDRISDMTTNIIRGPLIEYTTEMCNLYGVDLSAFGARQDQCVWNPVSHEWDQPEVHLPSANGKPIILVPKWIVRKQVNADSYFRDYLQPFIAERELENPNSEFVRLLKNKEKKANLGEILKAFGSKADIVDLLISDPGILQKYRAAVSDGDPRKVESNGVMNAVKADAPNLDKLLEAVIVIPSGNEHSTQYEQAVDTLFSAIFSDQLIHPKRQQLQNNGQKRLDMLWVNAAQSGFFHWAQNQCNASYVIGEYKNYSSEIANPEFDQIAMRFGPSKGQLGFLVCRNISNREAAIQRAREIRVDKHGYVIALDDEDLRKLVDAAKIGQDAIFAFLEGHFRLLAQ